MYGYVACSEARIAIERFSTKRLHIVARFFYTFNVTGIRHSEACVATDRAHHRQRSCWQGTSTSYFE